MNNTPEKESKSPIKPELLTNERIYSKKAQVDTQAKFQLRHAYDKNKPPADPTKFKLCINTGSKSEPVMTSPKKSSSPRKPKSSEKPATRSPKKEATKSPRKTASPKKTTSPKKAKTMSPKKEAEAVGGLIRTRRSVNVPELPEIPVLTEVSYSNSLEKINFPRYTSALSRPSSPLRIPEASFSQNGPGRSSDKNKVKVLKSIDTERLSSQRTGRRSVGYSLLELQEFSRELGISTSSKRKEELIKEIMSMKKNYGF